MHQHSSTTPTVSVVVPTYNMARFLPESALSILRQSYEDFELLIVDDGSTDNSQESVQDLLGDSRVRYLRKANGGEASARNEGVRQARGQFVAFNDADDVWFADKLAEQMSLFTDRPDVGVVYAEREWINEAGESMESTIVTRYRGSGLSQQLLNENFVPMSTPVIRREVFDACGLFDEELPCSVDYEFWLRVSTKYAFDFVERPLVAHRKWSGQMTRDRIGFLNASITISERFIDQHAEQLRFEGGRKPLVNRYSARGKTQASCGNYRGAVADFSKALRLSPGRTRTYRDVIRGILRRP